MTRTLEIPTELEDALQAKARRLKMPVEHYVIEVLRHDVEEHGASVQDEQRRRVLELRGCMAHTHGTVDDFLCERRAETIHDEA